MNSLALYKCIWREFAEKRVYLKKGWILVVVGVAYAAKKRTMGFFWRYFFTYFLLKYLNLFQLWLLVMENYVTEPWEKNSVILTVKIITIFSWSYKDTKRLKYSTSVNVKRLWKRLVNNFSSNERSAEVPGQFQID